MNIIKKIIICVSSISFFAISAINKVTEIYADSITTNDAKVIDGILLVNENYKLDEEYIADDMIKPNIKFIDDIDEEEKYMTKNAAEAFEKLFLQAEKEGIILKGVSGYRSYEEQKFLYVKNLILRGKDYVDDYVAVPGCSEHQTGLCLDVTNEEEFIDSYSEESKWLEENSYKFGIIIRYPDGKEKITGVKHEPWHLRYIGKEAANTVYLEDITLEEYLLNDKTKYKEMSCR